MYSFANVGLEFILLPRLSLREIAAVAGQLRRHGRLIILVENHAESLIR